MNCPSIGPKDVLCGRGGATNNHPGNQRFRAIVAEHMPEYLQAKKKQKAWIARTVVRTIQQDGGRFLKRDKDPLTGREVWTEVADKKATEKTSQALREGLDVRHKTYRPEKMSAGTRLVSKIHRQQHRQHQLRHPFQEAYLLSNPSSPLSYLDNPRTRTRLVEGTVLSYPTPSLTPRIAPSIHRIPKDPSQDDLAGGGSSCGSSLPDLQAEFFSPPRAALPAQQSRDPLQVFFEPPRITRADCEDTAAV